MPEVFAGLAEIAQLARVLRVGSPKIVYRGAAEIERFFDGRELLAPGVVPCSRWRPDPDDPDIDVNQYAGVGRKQ